ncbi:hypothetical protein CTM58_03570 [Prevotella intermedia]|uniref:Uncharacterized protein n=1 Tax=Prevotella intermedia TaxID=28131 RepID=A0A2M8TTL5_PREIN|nr:hypothetical protein CTM63_03030 [Prevotella intermedia]PJF00024.1 hypothetical protein CUB97_01280 [Prevotella intermedia]PJI27250.1 hypothetical protein CTM58_03570 [Prevotella intermedia]
MFLNFSSIPRSTTLGLYAKSDQMPAAFVPYLAYALSIHYNNKTSILRNGLMVRERGYLRQKKSEILLCPKLFTRKE